MSFIDDDLAFMLADFDAVAVTVGTITTTGHLEETDAVQDEGLAGSLQKRLTVLRCRRADFEDTSGALLVGRGDTVRIRGDDYTLTEVLAGDPNALVVTGRDGRELVLRVRKV